jgi:CBS domain-containing protein
MSQPAEQPYRPRRRTVADVMTTDVVTVLPTAGYKQIEKLMATHRISAVPVVDSTGRVIGIVSEADLLLKNETRTEHAAHWPKSRGRRVERAKAAAVTADNLMTSPVITVDPAMPLGVAARLMHDRRVKRLPVVSQGKLAGIVSRADILKVYLRSDDEIHAEVTEGVVHGLMRIDKSEVTVSVRDGVVFLEGDVGRSSEAEILVGLVQGIEGVVAVTSTLTFRLDDLAIAAASQARFQ